MNGSRSRSRSNGAGAGAGMGVGVGVDLDAIPRIDMVFHLATLQKWYEGRQEHGEVFEGDPLEHIFDELVDTNNYVSVAEQMGKINQAEAREIRHLVYELAAKIKTAHNRNRPPQPPVSASAYGGKDGGE